MCDKNRRMCVKKVSRNGVGLGIAYGVIACLKGVYLGVTGAFLLTVAAVAIPLWAGIRRVRTVEL